MSTDQKYDVNNVGSCLTGDFICLSERFKNKDGFGFAEVGSLFTKCLEQMYINFSG